MTTDLSPDAALDGIRVLDLSRVLAGPWATQILGDLGADVVKIENPDGGDDTRSWGPPFVPTPDGAPSDAAYFACCNRNKRSATVNFATEEGASCIRRLAGTADVLVENFKPGGLKKYGLEYASLSAINPRLVYCSITGFGQTGPYAHRPGYDFLIQGMGGLMSITGQQDGTPGAEPLKVGVAVCDLFTGMYAATAIIAALRHREKTGRGQHIDCSLLDSQVAMLANQASNWLNGGMVPGRLGNSHPNVVPYRVFATSDGHVIVSCGNDRQFARLCASFGLDDLADDRRYATNAARVRNRDSLEAILCECLARCSRDEALGRLEKAGVPCGPINQIPEVFADPQVVARGLQVNQQRGDGTRMRSTTFPPVLSETPASYRMAPPRLGAHTGEVLSSWAGLSELEVEALRQRRVIGDAGPK